MSKLRWDRARPRKVIEPLGEVDNTAKVRKEAESVPDAEGLPRFVVDDERTSRIHYDRSSNAPEVTIRTKKRITKTYGTHRQSDRGTLSTYRGYAHGGHVFSVDVADLDTADRSVVRRRMELADQLENIGGPAPFPISMSRPREWEWFSTVCFCQRACCHAMSRLHSAATSRRNDAHRARVNRHVASSAC